MIVGQKKYIHDLLQKVGVFNFSHLPTPMSSNFLSKVARYRDSSSSTDENLYKSIAGALQHVCITRPNSFFVINKLSQYI